MADPSINAFWERYDAARLGVDAAWAEYQKFKDTPRAPHLRKKAQALDKELWLIANGKNKD